MSTNILKFNILIFPVWWYGEGLVLVFRHTRAKWSLVMRSTGLNIFLRSMTQPLYGDYTRSGRIISFFVRLFLLFFMFLWIGFRLLFVFLALALYVFILPIVIIMIIYQLFPL